MDAPVYVYGVIFPVQHQLICSCYISLKVPKNSPKINRKAPEVQPPNVFLATSLQRQNAVLKAMATDIHVGVVQYDVMGRPIMSIILTIDRDFHGILEPRLYPWHARVIRFTFSFQQLFSQKMTSK